MVSGSVKVSVRVLEASAVVLGRTVTLVGMRVDPETLGKLVGKGWTGGFPPVSKVVMIDPVVSGRLPVAFVVVGVCDVGMSVEVTVCKLRLGSANVMADSEAEVEIDEDDVCRARRMERSTI